MRKIVIASAGASVLLVPALPGALAEVPAAAPTAVSAPAGKRVEPTQCLATSVAATANSRARYVWKRLRNAGYSPAASAGVISYLDQVSAISPHAINRPGKRVGVAQWTKDRWANYVARVESKGQNRWSFRKQVSFLMDEMATGSTFNDERFRVRVNPRKAARVFNRTFLAIGPDPLAVKEPLKLKADGWYRMLSPTQLSTKTDAVTYGSATSCAPPSVDLERCPMVPDSFKTYFANYTGFSWDEMSASAKLMSRCVYIRFPHIKSHGTYNGHSPVWSQAIDFMMPRGCVTGADGSYTRDSTDRAVGNRLAKYLFQRADRLNIDYLIWQDSIRNPGERSYEDVWSPIGNWRNDTYNNGDCTNTHFDHIHVSVYADVLAASATAPTPGLNPDGEPW